MFFSCLQKLWRQGIEPKTPGSTTRPLSYSQLVWTVEANTQPIELFVKKKNDRKIDWCIILVLFCFELIWRPGIELISPSSILRPLSYPQAEVPQHPGDHSLTSWELLLLITITSFINPEKLIAILDWHSIVLSHVLTPSFVWESNPHPPLLSADLWATGQRGQKVSGGHLPAFI